MERIFFAALFHPLGWRETEAFRAYHVFSAAGAAVLQERDSGGSCKNSFDNRNDKGKGRSFDYGNVRFCGKEERV